MAPSRISGAGPGTIGRRSRGMQGPRDDVAHRIVSGPPTSKTWPIQPSVRQSAASRPMSSMNTGERCCRPEFVIGTDCNCRAKPMNRFNETSRRP